MSLFVKICGITSVEAAEVAVESGADALGFVFAESPRQIAPSQAMSIAVAMPPEVQKVAVFLRPERGEIEAVLDDFTADLLQADHQSLTGVTGLPTLPVYRDTPSDVAILKATPDAGIVLFEGSRSGTGESVNWSRAGDLARTVRLVLGGGLTPVNVTDAIRMVRPHGVDVSSGVESSPGVKDVELIRDFIRTVRKVEKAMVGT